MDESLTAMVREAMPLAALLGFEAVEGSPGAVTLRGAWAAERCTAAGLLHGGYVMRALRDAGASLFVAGSSVFGAEDPAEAYARLAAAVT